MCWSSETPAEPDRCEHPGEPPAEKDESVRHRPLDEEKGRAGGLGQAGESDDSESGIAENQGGGIEGAVGGGQSGQGGG